VMLVAKISGLTVIVLKQKFLFLIN
jgi:hypothetical protein